MAEPSTITAAICAATVAICVPFLSALGIDPADAVFAACGCVCAQTLLPPRSPRTLLQIAALSVGSILLGALITPAAAEHLKVSAQLRIVLSLGIGAFAQPIAVEVKRRFDRLRAKRAGDGNA